MSTKHLLNETHNPALASWLVTANKADTDFPIQNLPFAVFKRANSEESFRGGVAIGDQVIDLTALGHVNVFDGLAQDAVKACSAPQLNDYMAMGKATWSALRLALSNALKAGSALQEKIAGCLIAQADVEYALPCNIGDYTDFYTSIHHATSVGLKFRPDNPLLPNYKWVPIGYHGRSSSIDVSGRDFKRPCGQTKAPTATEPSFGPCKRLDYELEVGIFIGKGNALGDAISIDNAEDHVFGLCLFNDWSARDIQGWEYQPLGPFLSKNFASTVSPWIVTTEALAPYRSSWTRVESDPQPMPYLESEKNRAIGSFDIQLQALLETQNMREKSEEAVEMSQSNFKDSYWTVAQMVAHHTVNGCNLRAGDMFGSGTQSGPNPEEAGSMLELSNAGADPITLPNGEKRTFLEDGDNVIMKGWCKKDGAARIGFGAVSAVILPAN
ncbi:MULTISPECIES: fumarylacetoacetase [unclassified Colwellia]|uniref:fumarylacetoacetase n=1 Tax=unclassified Colwellia TaxID=196834 RepID=UPI0015F3FAA3|nr:MULTISPECIES: fumarylacetoacetase [unclassified Colwellia]MBA6233451.1 fumarylacetoacetase [Colwellia sp. MB02u-7]MBA6236541.1 fumarylacetoacetase [Colwellia sp. MB02u-11]MBA6257075.1 fumarylacetoacetase [Colwellia sp. MB3u-28]MBA6260920.1 fumarylacetoacetase [Colwellia sp. MB3u-41]MBA6298060.1 fumarylacetoacetase [Colwellia sp. MB3u-22]